MDRGVWVRKHDAMFRDHYVWDREHGYWVEENNWTMEQGDRLFLVLTFMICVILILSSQLRNRPTVEEWKRCTQNLSKQMNINTDLRKQLTRFSEREKNYKFYLDSLLGIEEDEFGNIKFLGHQINLSEEGDAIGKEQLTIEPDPDNKSNSPSFIPENVYDSVPETIHVYSEVPLPKLTGDTRSQSSNKPNEPTIDVKGDTRGESANELNEPIIDVKGDTRSETSNELNEPIIDVGGDTRSHSPKKPNEPTIDGKEQSPNQEKTKLDVPIPFLQKFRTQAQIERAPRIFNLIKKLKNNKTTKPFQYTSEYKNLVRKEVQRKWEMLVWPRNGIEPLSPFPESTKNSNYLLDTSDLDDIHLIAYLKPYEIPNLPCLLHPRLPSNHLEQFGEIIETPQNLLKHLKLYDYHRSFPKTQVLNFSIRKVEELLSILDNKCQILSEKDAFDKTIFNKFDLLATPGLPFCRTIQMKADCLDWISTNCETLLEFTFNGIKKRVFPPVCFATTESLNGETKTEWVYPSVINLFERKFSTDIYEKLLDANFEKRLPFKFPGKDYTDILQKNGKSICEFEIIDFHPSISTTLVAISFKIIQKWVDFSSNIDPADPGGSSGSSAFDLDKDMIPVDLEQLWSHLVRYFIHTPILLPSGQLARKSTGAALGSEFTLLISTITGLIIGTFCMLSQNVDVDHDGDISVFAFGNSISISVPTSFSITQLIKDTEKIGFKIDSSSIRMKKN